LPHLSELIEILSSRYTWYEASGFMNTQQPSLHMAGRMTPGQWLAEGGDPADIRDLVEGTDWL